jgi:uncharacterized protein
MSTTKSSPAKVFLTAEWRFLAMLNYEIDPNILAPFIPPSTELDSWNGKTYVSLVGFLFQKARLGRIPIPFHRNFEEVNLRFYVRRKAGNSWRRGVVFVKELVPRRAVAFVARKFYNENYHAMPMAHHIEKFQEEVKSVSYFWRLNGRENFLKVTVCNRLQPPPEGSLPEFITEHYWGYAQQRDGSTAEYHVEHPRWRIWETQAAECHCNAADLYDGGFRRLFNQAPASAFLADGSEVKVYQGVKLTR